MRDCVRFGQAGNDDRKAKRSDIDSSTYHSRLHLRSITKRRTDKCFWIHCQEELSVLNSKQVKGRVDSRTEISFLWTRKYLFRDPSKKTFEKVTREP